MSVETQNPAPAHVYGPPVVVEVSVTVKALAVREADGGYSIVIPEIPGCVSEGETIEDAKAMIVEAAEGLLAHRHDQRRDEAYRSLTEPLPGEVPE